MKLEYNQRLGECQRAFKWASIKVGSCHAEALTEYLHHNNIKVNIQEPRHNTEHGLNVGMFVTMFNDVWEIVSVRDEKYTVVIKNKNGAEHTISISVAQNNVMD